MLYYVMDNWFIGRYRTKLTLHHYYTKALVWFTCEEMEYNMVT